MIMKALLVVLYVTAVLSAAEEKSNNVTTVRNDQSNKMPWLQMLFDSFFSLPSLNLPQSPAPAIPNRIRPTTTEYIEVTRRHTIHPVCYTMYEKKAPCLPHRSLDDEDPIMDFDVDHQVNIDVRNTEEPDMSEMMKPVAEVLEGRKGRYLEFVPRPEVPLEGSESQPMTPSTTSYRRPSSEGETFTKTVLLTKVERYTDHRITATVVALNCRPVDQAIPRCRRSLNPGKSKINTEGSIITTPVIKSESETEAEKTVEAVKKVTEAVKGQTAKVPQVATKVVQVMRKPSRRIILKL